MKNRLTEENEYDKVDQSRSVKEAAMKHASQRAIEVSCPITKQSFMEFKKMVFAIAESSFLAGAEWERNKSTEK